MMFSRRWLLVVILVSLSGCFSYFGGGKSTQDPLHMKEDLAKNGYGALALLNEAYQIGSPLVDHHLHLIGNGISVTQLIEQLESPDQPCGQQQVDHEADPNESAWINEERFDFFSHPFLWVQTKVLMDTMKIECVEKADVDSINRLLKLVQSLTMKGADGVPDYDVRIHILAIDGYYEKGRRSFDKKLTDVVIPNKYVLKLADYLNERVAESDPFVPVISINPYKAGALEELAELKNKTLYIKWVAPAQGFDPLDPYIDPFYEKVKEYGMVIMAHTGGEHSFDVKKEKFREFGDPFRMRRALDFGIPVILSHAGGDDDVRGRFQYRENFIQLMKDEKNEKEWCLFGDISALTQKKNFKHFDMFVGKDAHYFKYRMVFGSDYPLPAVGFLYPLSGFGDLIYQDYLAGGLKEPLDEILQYNPLAFDVVVKRSITVLNEETKERERLPKEMFMSLEENIKRELNDPARDKKFKRDQCRAWYEQNMGLINDR